jgi:hypothetical protein
MKQTTRLEIGYSPLTKRIMLAKMKDLGNGNMLRVGNDEGRDVTNAAAQCAWQLVMAEGGEISWNLENGDVISLKATKVEALK